MRDSPIHLKNSSRLLGTELLQKTKFTVMQTLGHSMDKHRIIVTGNRWVAVLVANFTQALVLPPVPLMLLEYTCRYILSDSFKLFGTFCYLPCFVTRPCLFYIDNEGVFPRVRVTSWCRRILFLLTLLLFPVFSDLECRKAVDMLWSFTRRVLLLKF